MSNRYIIISVLLMSIRVDGVDEWTWFFQKKMSDRECQHNHEKNEILLLRNDVPVFTQLIFSWNAVKPLTGYFSFWVQVRDTQKKAWSSWHKMVEWGSDVQRSFLSIPDDISRYHHVRLEAGSSELDAFRIKIMRHQGADLSSIKAFSVAVADFKKFMPESTVAYTQLKSIKINQVPRYSQFKLNHDRNEVMCSPTSCSMLIGYLTKSSVDPLHFAHHVYDTGLGAYGSWPFNMAHAYEYCNGSFWFSVSRLHSFAQLYNYLEMGTPVVVSVRGPLAGGARPYVHGHLLVVVGYDAKQQHVICHDPAFDNLDEVKKRYPLKDFLIAWERSRRLAYLAEKAV